MRTTRGTAAAVASAILFATLGLAGCGSGDTESKIATTPAPSCTPLPSPTASIAPSTIPVRIYNASDTSGLAEDVAIEMRARQFRVLSTGNYGGDSKPAAYATITYGAIGKQIALTLAQQVKNPTLVQDTRTDPSVDLVLGPKFALVPVPPPPANRVRLNVWNTTAITGLAGDTAKQLSARGFKVIDSGNDPAGHFWPDDTAVVLHGKEGEPYARRVALQIKGARLVEDDRDGTDVDLDIGSKFDGLVPAAQATPTPSPSNSGCG